MPKKQYQVQLTDEERNNLTSLLKKGTIAARKLAHAQILLVCCIGCVFQVYSSLERSLSRYTEVLRASLLPSALPWSASGWWSFQGVVVFPSTNKGGQTSEQESFCFDRQAAAV